jgi:hypothetical protein
MFHRVFEGKNVRFTKKPKLGVNESRTAIVNIIKL